MGAVGLSMGAVGRVRPLPNGVLAEGCDGQASSSQGVVGGGGGAVREGQGDVTITVASGASCRHLLALLTAAVRRESCDGAEGEERGENGKHGCVGLGSEGMLHKVVDHDVALDCPAVHCLWCRTLASMDGRPRGSLSRPARDAPVLAPGSSDAGRGGKSPTVDEMLRRQAKARRRFALPSDSPYVLYYEFVTSIHAPSSGALQVRWLQS